MEASKRLSPQKASADVSHNPTRRSAAGGRGLHGGTGLGLGHGGGPDGRGFVGGRRVPLELEGPERGVRHGGEDVLGRVGDDDGCEEGQHPVSGGHGVRWRLHEEFTGSP